MDKPLLSGRRGFQVSAAHGALTLAGSKECKNIGNLEDEKLPLSATRSGSERSGKRKLFVPRLARIPALP